MNSSNTIFTFGIGHVSADILRLLLDRYAINCVVDARDERMAQLTNIGLQELQDILRKRGIVYLPFHKEFGTLPAAVRNKYGIPVYGKVIKDGNFLRGIRRIEDGIGKGYRILIIEAEGNIYISHRYLLIGLCLSQHGYSVTHIHENLTAHTQEQVDEQLTRRRAERLKDKEKAAEVGRAGEEIAALHLMRMGYMILDHNWNLHRGCELDLVARKDGVLHFVEVKTRSNLDRGTPDMAINHRKLKNIGIALREYISLNGYHDLPYQVDSVAIVYKNDNDYTFEFKQDIKETIN